MSHRYTGLPEITGHARIPPMAAPDGDPIDLEALETKFRRWRAEHKTPDTIVAAHRAVILERVAQSMTFEGEPITVTRLKLLLGTTK